MTVLGLIRGHRWPTLFGYGLFIGMMSAGYAYNVTFIQLGLIDLGKRLLWMDQQTIAGQMALLAICTCGVALITGSLMMRSHWGKTLAGKLRLAWVSVTLQTLLTWFAPSVSTQSAFTVWIVAASLALGIGVPATFSLTVDFIPRRARGYAAAAITAGAYFLAAVVLTEWRIETFAAQMLILMIPGWALISLLAFVPLPFMRHLADQHWQPAFGDGRFVRRDTAGRAQVLRKPLALILIMFGVFFVDSLGFLRLLETPVYMNTAWQAPDPDIRLFIGAMHVLGALAAGILYTAFDEHQLFLWIFGIFALVHLMYSLHLRTAPGESAPLAMPMLYAIAVSLYTVVNFALWADISTADTISRNSAVGVAFSGWTATFLSTALAIQWQRAGMPLETHLNIVDSFALLFFLALLVGIFWKPRVPPSEGKL